MLILKGYHTYLQQLHANTGMTVKIQSVHKRLSQYSFPYIGIKQTSYIHNSEKAAIKYNISILVRSYVLRYSEQTRLQPLTNPSEDSQAWKTYSYLDEGAARGTEWDNRRIRCTVALHWEWLQHHPLYRRQSNLAVMCKDTYLPGEHFSTTFLYIKKKKMEMNADSSMSLFYILNIWSQ